ncbi:protein of unknown function (DU1801) [Devosia sp. YR412]|uniref:DUF1801 domain-containing protein n=1 Tax=Devosia sp. YR412 TaxID=1881030 RepID=UPI0008CACC3A|nr:DUF1801 domain-containing protein [Devosia sp. YR412]SEQ38597.1 protein of unknown function (DU1801) [Devosia sp. YR412]
MATQGNTDKPVTVDDYNAIQSSGDRALCDLLRKVIDEALPDAENKIWHAHPVWFLAGNPIVGYSKLKGGVRLLFWSGQSFEVQGLEPEGSFKAAEKRYTASDQIDVEQLNTWLGQARSIQWDYKNLVKKRRLDRLT